MKIGRFLHFTIVFFGMGNQRIEVQNNTESTVVKIDGEEIQLPEKSKMQIWVDSSLKTYERHRSVTVDAETFIDSYKIDIE